MTRARRIVVGLLGAGLVSLQVASAQSEEADVFADPALGANRTFFELNRGIDELAMRPLATAYRETFPAFARRGISNALDNLQAPTEALSHLLQLDFDAAATTTARFAINSTLGVAGFADVAGKAGLERQPTDFGLALAHYGFGEGPYLVVPLLGPTTVRDLTGVAFDVFANPLHVGQWAELKQAEWVGFHSLAAADARLEYGAVLDEVYYETEFGYTRLRSYYLQNRRHQATGGVIGDESLPSLDFGDDG